MVARIGPGYRALGVHQLYLMGGYHGKCRVTLQYDTL